ncbi:MAG: gliding motility-associated ABC transporter substrate-binding protein GldG [Cyclobacteriaceae bacterium]|nr:gliding motility-associated ABC transporter substrate-binding protein GldG [Cyclobacteriaceae bacterium]
MVARSKRKIGDVLFFLNGLMLAVVLVQLSGLYFLRLDLTEEKRYSIKAPTKTLLQNLDDDVFIDVFLDGDLNAEFRRLRKNIRETLDEFRIHSNNRVHYRFADPLAAAGQQAREEFMADLVARGVKPMNIIESKDGRRSEKLVFPGAIVSYGGLQTGVMLLRDQAGQGSQEDLNSAIENLEFELANAIQQLVNTDRKRIGFLTGHGELDSISVSSLREGLLGSYEVNLGVSADRNILSGSFDVIVVAKPQSSFSEKEKYFLDQYVLRGGKLILLLDALRASMDSVSQGNYYAFPYQLHVEDLLFQYGVRINADFVQDLVSLRYPVVTGNMNGTPQITPMEWPFFPLVNHYAAHPMTKNLDATALRFASSMDSVKAMGIRKTPLLFSSTYARRVSAPLKINVNDLRKEINPKNFASGPYVFGYLLEGKFTSLFRNRFLPDGVDSTGIRTTGVETKIVVIADGDLARNEMNRRSGQPVELGFDAMTNHTFANRELLLHMIAYLTDDSGLITARSKELLIRPLNKERIRNSRMILQSINILVPVGIIIALTLIKMYWRQRRYGHFNPGSDGK